MTKIKIDYIKRYRYGEGWRTEFRRKGYPSKVLPDIDDPGFMEAYLAAKHAPKLFEAPKTFVIPGTMIDVVQRALASARYAALKDGWSRTKYKERWTKIAREYGQLPVAELTTAHIDAWMVRVKDAVSRGAANQLRFDLMALMQAALLHKMIAIDPTVGTKRMKHRKQHYHTWTEAQIDQFEAKWPIGTPERLSFEMLLCTGQRSIDVRLARWEQIDWDANLIEVVQEKTGETVWVPLLPSLCEALDAAPRQSPMIIARITKETGEALTSSGFAARVQGARKAADLPDKCVPHGLRRAAARRLAEASCTQWEIMTITGHTDPRMVEEYIRDAAKKEGARMAHLKVRRAMDAKAASLGKPPSGRPTSAQVLDFVHHLPQDLRALVLSYFAANSNDDRVDQAEAA